MNTQQLLTFLAINLALGSSFYVSGMEELNKKLSEDEADQIFFLYVKYFQKANSQYVWDSINSD